MGHTIEEASEMDTRQLYSEVTEETRSGPKIGAAVDPIAEHRVAS